MPLGDLNPTAPAVDTLLSDAEKDQNAANVCDAASKRMLNRIQRCIDTMNQAITDAPGNKATVLALTTGGATDIQALADAVMAAHESHKAAADASLAF